MQSTGKHMAETLRSHELRAINSGASCQIDRSGLTFHDVCADSGSAEQVHKVAAHGPRRGLQPSPEASENPQTVEEAKALTDTPEMIARKKAEQEKYGKYSSA